MQSRKMYSLKVMRDEFEMNPRISLVQLHGIVRKKAGVRMRETTKRYLDWGMKNGIIGPPRPALKFYSNIHQHVEFIEGGPTEYETIVKEKKNIRYACALTGSSEIIMLTSFSSRGDDLTFQAFTRADGYNSTESECLQKFKRIFGEEPVILDERMDFLDWNDIDWKLFTLLSPDLRMKFSSLSKGIGLGWRSIKTRIENKILPFVNIATYLFPKGQMNYQQLYLDFKTDFQENFLNVLDYMHTTTYFLRIGKKGVGIFLFPENMNNVLKVFRKFEREGIIDDLQYYLPLAWYHTAELSWPGACTWTSSTGESDGI
jgi:hypothetical protein